MSECQIWLDDTKYVVVDEIDYEWAKQWRWRATFNSTGKKFYATRNTRERGTRRQITVYMHKDILLRSGKRAPTKHHSIGDHDDGDSSNNRRGNLFWATLRMNNTKHRHKHVLQQIMRFDDMDAEHR